MTFTDIGLLLAGRCFIFKTLLSNCQRLGVALIV